jgi:hypothetical protein
MAWVHYRAPFEFFDVDQTGNIIGHMVESYVVQEYLRHVGRPNVYPFNPKDYSDFTAGFANTTLYTAFLKQNNPQLSVSQLLKMRLKGIRRIPDICTHDYPRREEYYEIKPRSVSGLLDGQIKLAEIQAFNDAFSLPYRAGKIFSPNTHVIFFDDTLQGIPTQLAIRYQRVEEGLIAYDIAYSRWPIVLTEKDTGEIWAKLLPLGLKHFADSVVRRFNTVRPGRKIIPG